MPLIDAASSGIARRVVPQMRLGPALFPPVSTFCAICGACSSMPAKAQPIVSTKEILAHRTASGGRSSYLIETMRFASSSAMAIGLSSEKFSAFTASGWRRSSGVSSGAVMISG